MTFTLTSSAFGDGQGIPAKYTCQGDDISPPLSWQGIPQGTRSLALVVEDPDAPDPAAPKRTYVHWVVYNLPADTGALPEDADRGGYPTGSKIAFNDWGRADYGGPCPPIGRHRYFHRLYALDIAMDDLQTTSLAELRAVMKGHIIAEAQLVGTYQKT